MREEVAAPETPAEEVLGPVGAHLAKSVAVTALMPVKRPHPGYLREALDSIFRQTDAGWRLIIIGEPSDRDALERALAGDLRDARVTLVDNEGRRLAGAFNTGMRHAPSEFVAILFADDMWSPDAVAVVRREIDAHPEVDFFHSSRIIVDDTGSPVSEVLRSVDDVGLRDFAGRSPVKHLLCWRREKALSFGGMDESLESVGPDDFDFPWTMAEHGAVFHAIPECLYLYRDHRSAYRLTTHLPRNVHTRGIRRILRKHGYGRLATERRLRAARNTYLRQCLYRSPLDRWLKRRLGLAPRPWRDSYPDKAAGPFFVVGCPRSGTTLLRRMLMCHPSLAIPWESDWLVDLAPDFERTRTGRWPEDALTRILEHEKFDWSVPTADEIREFVARRSPASYAELVDAVFGAYAASQGKPRWGDKTTSTVLHIPLLSDLFPDAPFVHIIRDGRDVAASLMERSWWDASAADSARWWRKCVEAGRRDGQRLGSRYLEVRLEDLIGDPEGELQRVCGLLGERYTPAMLYYQPTGAELSTWSADDWDAHSHLRKPPTPGLRDWRARFSPQQQSEVERICAPLLEELGYPAPARV